MKNLAAILLTTLVSFSSLAAVIDAPVGERWVAIADKPGVYRVDVYDYDKGEYDKGVRYDYVTEQTVIKKYDPVTGDPAGTATVTPTRDTKWNWEQSQGIDNNAQGIEGNAQGVAANAQGVANNAQGVQDNAGGIASNAAHIGSVQRQVTSNTESLGQVKEDVNRLENRVDGLEASMEKMGDQMLKVNDRLDQTTATTHAVVNARPMTHTTGDFAMGVGMGYANGAQAIAIGGQYQVNLQLSVSATLNHAKSHGKAGSDTSAGLGAHYVF